MRAEINSFRVEVNARFDKMHSDRHTFFSLTGELKRRIDTLEKRH